MLLLCGFQVTLEQLVTLLWILDFAAKAALLTKFDFTLLRNKTLATELEFRNSEQIVCV